MATTLKLPFQLEKPDNNTYVTDAKSVITSDGVTTVEDALGVNLKEAPIDGGVYGRRGRDGSWVKINDESTIQIVTCESQEVYDAISPKESNTIYLIE